VGTTNLDLMFIRHSQAPGFHATPDRCRTDAVCRQPEDIVRVQDDVAIAVAREIQLRLTPQQLSPPRSLFSTNGGRNGKYQCS
jgi:hypothetical protein